jgi:hypothetical protein
MSRNAKRVRISIINPPSGCQSSTSLEHARRYVRRGTAEWAGNSIQFIHRREHQAQKPTIGRIVSRLVGQFSGRDSGFTTLPYPQRSSGNGPAYRTLSKMGAGL